MATPPFSSLKQVIEYATRKNPRRVYRAVIWSVACLATLSVLFVVRQFWSWYRYEPHLRGSGIAAVSANTVDHVVFSLDEFYKEYNYYPDGGNRATVAALRGEDTNANPRKKEFFYIQDPVHGPPVLNAGAQLVDGWGYPLVIRGGGTTRPTVYSIGANGVDELGRGDDILPENAATPSRQIVPSTTPAPANTSPPSGAHP